MINMNNLFTRLNNAGGKAQQDRMIEDKLKSLQRAVKYSYQGATIQKDDSIDIIPALINPNKLIADYDEKIISLEYKYGLKSGSVFKWLNPLKQGIDTYWLVYLQDLTELAYFKANIRRCNYEIKWSYNNQSFSTYASIRGPKEQSIQDISKSQFNMDVPNYTLSILVPKTPETLQHFQRYTKFYLRNISDNDTPICWRIEAIDSISLQGVLELYAREYYANDDEDDIPNGIVGGLIEPLMPPEQIDMENKEIVGDNFIRPKSIYTYIANQTDAEWNYDKTLPIKIVNIDNNRIDIMWTKNYSGQFILSYGNCQKTIYVQSIM